MATTDLHFVAGALQPVKRGVRLIGGTSDDGIQVDDAIVAIVAGNHTIGTISAWIMVADSINNCCIFGTGDANAVEYTTFLIKAGKLSAKFVKATPTNTLEVDTPAGSIKPHTWHHVALVQDGTLIKLYIDGEVQLLSFTTKVNPGQWYEDLNNIDSATIGAADSIAGGAALTQEFKGYISDVRIWSGTTSTNALTETQINQVMSGQSVGTPHNLWTLNGDLVDDGSGADNGTAVGDIIFSDANPFASRLTFLETAPLAADNISISCDNGVGYAYSVLAA